MSGEMNVREIDKYSEVLIGKPEIKKLYLYSCVRSPINLCMHVCLLPHVY